MGELWVFSTYIGHCQGVAKHILITFAKILKNCRCQTFAESYIHVPE